MDKPAETPLLLALSRIYGLPKEGAFWHGFAQVADGIELGQQLALRNAGDQEAVVQSSTPSLLTAMRLRASSLCAMVRSIVSPSLHGSATCVRRNEFSVAFKIIAKKKSWTNMHVLGRGFFPLPFF